MKRLFTCLFLSLSATVVSAASLTSNTVANLSWGSGDKQVAMTQVPAYNLGPPSLASDGKIVYLLDAANQRIVGISLSEDKKFSSIPLDAEGATDFCLDAKARFHVLYAGEFRLASRDGDAWTSQSLDKANAPLSLECGSEVLIGAFDGNFYRPGNTKPLAFPPVGAYQVTLPEQTASRWRFDLKSPQQSTTLTVEHSKADIISVNFLGADNRGNIYALVEEDSGDTATRDLRMYSADGKLLTQQVPPISSYTYLLKEFTVLPDGGVLQMLSTESGINVMRWSISSGARSKGSDDELRRLQQQLDKQDANPDVLPSETPKPSSSSSRSGSGGKVSRDEVMALAKQYADYRFTVTWDNLTNGTNYGGKIVVTPLTQPGTYIGVPYKWGGDDTLEAFVQGLAAGKKAGDKCAIKKHGNCPGGYYEGRNAAVGVDCSGFVSNLWKSGRYSTHNLPSISNSIDWNQLKPGDILNRAGKHVMVFYGSDRSGNIFVYEATGTGNYWKVVNNRHAYTKLRREGYQPYRYRNIVDTTATQSQPPPKIPVALDIAGSMVIIEGQSSPYTATVAYSDGSRRSVTSAAQWTENSAYAFFNGSVLQTEVIGRNENVTVQATYQEAGKTVQASSLVSIQGKQDIQPHSPVQRIKQLGSANPAVKLEMWLDNPDKRDFKTTDKPVFHYSVGSQPRGSVQAIQETREVYFTLINIAPAGNWLLWLENEPIAFNKSYTWPRGEDDWLPGQTTRTNKQFNLDKGQEYLKGIITSKPIIWTEVIDTGSQLSEGVVLDDAELQLSVE